MDNRYLIIVFVIFVLYVLGMTALAVLKSGKGKEIGKKAGKIFSSTNQDDPSKLHVVPRRNEKAVGATGQGANNSEA